MQRKLEKLRQTISKLEAKYGCEDQDVQRLSKELAQKLVSSRASTPPKSPANSTPWPESKPSFLTRARRVYSRLQVQN